MANTIAHFDFFLAKRPKDCQITHLSSIRRYNRQNNFTKLSFFSKTNKKDMFSWSVSKKSLPLHPRKSKRSPHTPQQAPVAKLVDALDLGSSNASCVGSSPIRRTKTPASILSKMLIINNKKNKINAGCFIYNPHFPPLFFIPSRSFEIKAKDYSPEKPQNGIEILCLHYSGILLLCLLWKLRIAPLFSTSLTQEQT